LQWSGERNPDEVPACSDGGERGEGHAAWKEVLFDCGAEEVVALCVGGLENIYDVIL
jgi:hypothetical protein